MPIMVYVIICNTTGQIIHDIITVVIDRKKAAVTAVAFTFVFIDQPPENPFGTAEQSPNTLWSL